MTVSILWVVLAGILLVAGACVAVADEVVMQISSGRAKDLAAADPTRGGRVVRVVVRRGVAHGAAGASCLMLRGTGMAIVASLAMVESGPAAVAAGVAAAVVVTFMTEQLAVRVAGSPARDAAVFVSVRVVMAARMTMGWAARLGALPGDSATPSSGGTGNEHVDRLYHRLDKIRDAGDLDQERTRMIESVIAFAGRVVREVMVPRPDMIVLSRDVRIEDARKLATEHGISRIPVYGSGGVDEIAGMLYVKDILRVGRAADPKAGIASLLRPAHFVPERKRLADLLNEMRDQRYLLAIVVDEYGGTAGLVTLEDLIEELVGDIDDEYDTSPAMIERRDDGVFRVAGRLGVAELGLIIGVDVAAGEADTVGGAMLALLGKVPVAGDEVVDPRSGVSLRAVEVEGNRIERVDVVLPAPRGENEADAGSRERSSA